MTVLWKIILQILSVCEKAKESEKKHFTLFYTFTHFTKPGYTIYLSCFKEVNDLSPNP